MTQYNQQQECKGRSEDSFEYIFGFGSIINTTTHAPWLRPSSAYEVASLPGAVATLKKSFGYTRQWNFRSSTGFTALGVSLCDSQQLDSNDINGVLFRINSLMLPGFDRREVGYKKVSIPLEHLHLHYDLEDDESSSNALKQQTIFQLTPQDKIWLYVPLSSHAADADQNHPILQSYVDTVLQGCLEWGGVPMAEQFIVTTGGWSQFFLNDTPSSRRPWLFRKEYNTIDRLLEKYLDRTHYGDRRHPEEFASIFHRRMKGTWSIPRRNPNFTGRDSELELLHQRLSAQDGGRQKAVAIVEVAGMGGVGKTQLVTEYCYRQFSNQYGLVAWFNAESIDSLVADYRQLLADMAADGDLTPSDDTDEIICEVKTRLFRSQVPWLLVFDNLEDRKLLARFVPRGAGMKGHVLVSTRQVDTLELNDEVQGPIILGCFSPEESLELLRRAAGSDNMLGRARTLAATDICQRLGHLPLALSMAAAYMRRCDVNCAEYLDRYTASEKSGQSLLRHGKLSDYSFSVASSLSLSLGAIEKESPMAVEVLRLLCFLGPDQITKTLLRSLLAFKNRADEESLEGEEISSWSLAMYPLTIVSIITMLGASILLTSSLGHHKSRLVGASVLGASIFVISANIESSYMRPHDTTHGLKRSSSTNISFSAHEYEQADLIWDILKSFSILTVKDGKGIIHRLLSQAMRASQSAELCRRNLRICLDTVCSTWTFRTDMPETWRASISILDHAKHLVSNVADHGQSIGSRQTMRAAQLSIDAGVLSAMALNVFIEAQALLEIALQILEASNQSHTMAFRTLQARTHYELGKVFRYHGEYVGSEKSLNKALQIYTSKRQKDPELIRGEASTLHEIGVLEVKKHNLNAAVLFLQKALDMRRVPGHDLQIESNDADCAATLHQLAAVHVARKPPDLNKAKALLEEALSMSRQIGQRAATLKQLARVTIRQGDLEVAELYLKQALELYIELYGDSKMHINIAAVKFQQGALALQRGQNDDAFLHYSECLRIRRHVYSYTRPLEPSPKDVDPCHLEVAVVLHELGRTLFAQKRYPQAIEFMNSEKAILLRLMETTTQMDRIWQARLTNITWMSKCAKAMGHDELCTLLAAEKSKLKRQGLKESLTTLQSHDYSVSPLLLQKVLHCRKLARQFALEGDEEKSKELDAIVANLQEESSGDRGSNIEKAILDFCDSLEERNKKPKNARKIHILGTCDELRYEPNCRGSFVTNI